MNVSYAETFTEHLDSLLLLLLLVLEAGGALMARGMGFRKPRLGEYTAPSGLCSYQYPPEVSHCSRNRISVSSGKGLDLITNDVFLILKYDGNFNWWDFHTIRKAQM